MNPRDAPEVDDDWRVGIIWLTRSLQRPDRMIRRRVRAARRQPDEPETGEPQERSLAGDALDGASGCMDAGDVPIVLAVAGVIVVIVALVALGPGLLAITIGLLEIAVLLILAAAGLVGRVIFRQPWEIVARRPGHELVWRVRGIRRARAVADEIETGLRQGRDANTLAPAHVDPAPPDLSGVPNVYQRSEFRLLGRVCGAALAIAIVVAVALLLLR